MSSALVKQLKEMERQWDHDRRRADRADAKLHVFLEHNGIDDMDDRLEVAEAAVERLEAVIDALELPKRGKKR